jgi:hypothetical protein
MSAVAMRTSGISDSSVDGLIKQAHRLLAIAEAEGAEEAEVFGVCGRSADVDLRKSEIELASESFHRGLGLRATVRGAVGFSSTSDMSRLDAVAISAVRSARARGKDEFWRFPSQRMSCSRKMSLIFGWLASVLRSVWTWHPVCSRDVSRWREPSLFPEASPASPEWSL